MKQLFLFQQVIFIDWHGVLSQDPFWLSILQSETHPLRPELAAKLGEIFSSKSTSHEWMKGNISSETIISEMGIWLNKRFREDFLLRACTQTKDGTP